MALAAETLEHLAYKPSWPVSIKPAQEVRGPKRHSPSWLAAELERKQSLSQWYALYTRSRHEKSVDAELQKKGFRTFLPVRKFTSQWSDRKKTIEEPLFPGYLFVHLALQNRLPVLQTAGAVRFVGPSKASPLAVPEKDLQSIRQFIDHDMQMDPFPYLKEGTRVYVRCGPLKGAEGFIVRKDKQCRLVVSLDLLMQSISIQVPEAWVEIV